MSILPRVTRQEACRHIAALLPAMRVVHIEAAVGWLCLGVCLLYDLKCRQVGRQVQFLPTSVTLSFHNSHTGSVSSSFFICHFGYYVTIRSYYCHRRYYCCHTILPIPDSTRYFHVFFFFFFIMPFRLPPHCSFPSLAILRHVTRHWLTFISTMLPTLLAHIRASFPPSFTLFIFHHATTPANRFSSSPLMLFRSYRITAITPSFYRRFSHNTAAIGYFLHYAFNNTSSRHVTVGVIASITTPPIHYISFFRHLSINITVTLRWVTPPSMFVWPSPSLRFGHWLNAILFTSLRSHNITIDINDHWQYQWHIRHISHNYHHHIIICRDRGFRPEFVFHAFARFSLALSPLTLAVIINAIISSFTLTLFACLRLFSPRSIIRYHCRYFSRYFMSLFLFHHFLSFRQYRHQHTTVTIITLPITLLLRWYLIEYSRHRLFHTPSSLRSISIRSILSPMSRYYHVLHQ